MARMWHSISFADSMWPLCASMLRVVFSSPVAGAYDVAIVTMVPHRACHVGTTALYTPGDKALS